MYQKLLSMLSIGNKPSILIIDTHTDTVLLLSKMLAEHGYRVHSAQTGQDALLQIRTLLPDLLIMATQLGDMSGFELCRQLKESTKLNQIPVVFLGMIEENGFMLSAFEAGCADFVAPPYRPAEIAARVKLQLDMAALRLSLEHKNKEIESQYNALKQLNEELCQLNEELHQTNDSLLESRSIIEDARAQFEQLFNLNPDAVTITRVSDGKIIQANESSARLFGDALENFVGKTTMQAKIWSSPKDREAFVHELHEKGGCKDFETTLCKKDGSTFDALLTTSVFDIDGVAHMISVTHDISDRKKIEEDLKASERSLKESQEIAGLGSYVFDLRTGIWTSSEILDRIFGIGPDYVRDYENWAQFIHPAWREQMKRYFAEEVIGKRRRFDKEYKVVRPCDGSECWVHGLGQLEYDMQGNPIKITGTIVDITERKIGQEKIKESEELFRFLAENSTDMIARHDPQGIFLYVTPSCLPIVGYQPEELLGRSAFEFFHPDDMAAVENNRQKIIAQPTFSTITFRFRHKNGSYIWLESGTRTIFDKETGKVLELHASSRDVTQRHEAEEALAASELRYRTLFGEMLEGFALHEIICGADGKPADYRFLDINPAFERLTGLPASLAVGRTVLEIMPQTEPFWIENYGKVALEGTPMNFENYSAELGKYFKINAFSPQKGQFAVLFEDITERKHIEIALAQSERKYRNLVDNSLVGVFQTHIDGKLLYANDAMVEMMEYGKPKDVLGENILALYKHPAERKKLIDTITAHGKITGYETVFITKQGKEKTILLNAILNNTVIDGTIIDISELKHTEEALRQERSRLSIIMDTSPVGIVILDRDGDITYSNARGVQILQLSKDDITQRTYNAPLWKITDVEGNDFPMEELPFAKVQATGKPCYNVQHGIEAADGHRIILSINAAPLFGADAKFDGMIASIEDISEAKQNEGKIRQQNKELIELNASKDKFFSIIAHDLRGPLSSVQMLNKILITNYKDYDKDGIFEIITMFDKVMTRTYFLLENLLEWAILQRSSLAPKSAQVNINELVAEMAALFEEKARSKQILLANNVPPLLCAACDADMSKTIVRNLLSNALKFVGKGGLVSVEAEEKAGFVEIRVHDNGQGIAPDQIPRLFNIAENETSLGTDNESGTGLGLPLCRELAEKQGGTIWVTSEIGKGSTFCFTLKCGCTAP